MTKSKAIDVLINFFIDNGEYTSFRIYKKAKQKYQDKYCYVICFSKVGSIENYYEYSLNNLLIKYLFETLKVLESSNVFKDVTIFKGSITGYPQNIQILHNLKTEDSIREFILKEEQKINLYKKL